MHALSKFYPRPLSVARAQPHRSLPPYTPVDAMPPCLRPRAQCWAYEAAKRCYILLVTQPAPYSNPVVARCAWLRVLSQLVRFFAPAVIKSSSAALSHGGSLSTSPHCWKACSCSLAPLLDVLIAASQHRVGPRSAPLNRRTLHFIVAARLGFLPISTQCTWR